MIDCEKKTSKDLETSMSVEYETFDHGFSMTISDHSQYLAYLLKTRTPKQQTFTNNSRSIITLQTINNKEHQYYSKVLKRSRVKCNTKFTFNCD
mmetsp:Transcript_18440/g.22694  ORF Transcript_18440/g.22694 Transcript_18440/m.22694 type:complete len:94 (-) Transcript_18440:375-656(-)